MKCNVVVFDYFSVVGFTMMKAADVLFGRVQAAYKHKITTFG